MSRYLSIARNAVRANERDERDEESPMRSHGLPEQRYERNESDEESPDLLGDDEARALGLDPALRWVRVYAEPVEPTRPPADWDGSLPDCCGWPELCRALGPCPRSGAGGACCLDRSPS
jgi:hypothetical protein